MVGWPPSVVRALVFWMLLVVLRKFGVERVHVPTLFAFTALVGLLILPHAVISPSFWLSLGIASALLWSFQIGSYVAPVLSIWFASSLAFSGVSLIVLFYPVIALVSAVVMAVFMFAILFPGWGWLAGYIAHGISLLPALGFPFYIRTCSFWALLFVGLLLILRKRLKLGVLLVLVPVLLSIFLVWMYPVVVAVFDVGEGSSALVRASGINLVVDTGRPNPKALLGITRGIAQMGVNRIDLVVLSHPDLDHTGGYRYIPGMSRVRAIGNDLDCGVIRSIGGIKLWFPPCVYGWGDNERSIVVFRPKSFVIFGDLEDRGMDAFFLGVHTRACPVDLVVMPHHGSWDNRLPDMLEACRPKVAVISVGHNHYGHPNKKTLHLLENVGIPLIWRTDDSGSAVFLFDRSGRLQKMCPLNHWWWVCVLWGL
jgi:beta-lactamase superfamily II metal-dependent hydrolase